MFEFLNFYYFNILQTSEIALSNLQNQEHKIKTSIENLKAECETREKKTALVKRIRNLKLSNVALKELQASRPVESPFG